MGKDCTDDMITSSANQQMKHLSQLMKRAKRTKKRTGLCCKEQSSEAPAENIFKRRKKNIPKSCCIFLGGLSGLMESRFFELID